MLALWVLVAMVSITTYFSVANQVGQPTREQLVGTSLAGNMAVYRDAVLTYLRNNPGFIGTTIPANQLPLPTWGYVPNSIWAHYIAPDSYRTIVIYASTRPPVDITAELMELSKNSILAGRINTATNRLESPVHGNTNILIPLPPGATIPNGTPVWLAYRS